MNETFSSETFLGWQKEFEKQTEIPFLYENFTLKKRPQISFSTSFQGLSAPVFPSCGEILGKCRIIAQVFSESLDLNHKGFSHYGVDIITKYLIPFFHKRYQLDRSSLEISETLVSEDTEQRKRTLLHVCEFELKNIFVLGGKLL